MPGSSAAVQLRRPDEHMAVRITESALAAEGIMDLAEFHLWFAHRRATDVARVERIALDDLVRWGTDPDSGDLVHDSGGFFAVRGLSVENPGAAVPAWTQPIIDQPEIGILGILVKEFDGVLHCLMQAKNEPGNFNGVQLSPTVQATRSNYTRLHQGSAVPYLEYFQDTARHRVVADVLQSEQGAWFYHKRNRNIVVEVTEDVELRDGFCWLTLGQLHQLLDGDDLVNMDSRTVLSCLPFSGVDLAAVFPLRIGSFGSSVIRSCSDEQGALHTTDEILSWITEARARAVVRTRPVPLDHVRRWQRTSADVSHETGRFFKVIGISVRAENREVAGWTQPMVEPVGLGINAFLVKRVDGVLHVLVNARIQPGYLDVVELAPTVQATPDNYTVLPAEARPRFLSEVLEADPDRIRFDRPLSEEGGRFHHARNRYLVIEADEDYEPDDAADFRWLTLHQLVGLLRHSHYVNVEARSLIACVHSLVGAAASG
ncbi:NDP-hexose 2,3-dehydratase family protein [Streptomyces hokutonensis]|uniref:NDP-hexose 2,3-dehydratase family protein n=1 Tax=Streptomyces hokutonensis TaxID=1306990 RepID=UPI0003A608C3|nr:NDP-hexose 2,3-dehydratase family protein [Streptomyces hokutonensis]